MKLTDGIYKLLPIYHNGEIKSRLDVRFIYYNSKYYYTFDNNLYSIIQKCYHDKNILPGIMTGNRHYHNILNDNSIKTITFGKSLVDIISKCPELFDINSNAHLKIVEGEKFIGGTTFRDYKDSHKVDIEWVKPDIDYENLLIDSGNKLTDIINRNTLKDVSVLGKDFESFYNKEIAKIRDKKIEKLMISNYTKLILNNTKSF